MRKMLYFVQDFNKIRGWSTQTADYPKLLWLQQQAIQTSISKSMIAADRRGKEGGNAHIAHGGLASGADAGGQKSAEGAGAVRG